MLDRKPEVCLLDFHSLKTYVKLTGRSFPDISSKEMGMGKKDLPVGYRNKLMGLWAVTVNYRNRKKRSMEEKGKEVMRGTLGIGDPCVVEDKVTRMNLRNKFPKLDPRGSIFLLRWMIKTIG